MRIFIKTERFTREAKKLSSNERKKYILEHKYWVKKIELSGKKIISGYLTNEFREPGGGGLLLVQANTYQEAKVLILEDPMIKNNLVTWDLKEWVYVAGTKINLINEDNPS